MTTIIHNRKTNVRAAATTVEPTKIDRCRSGIVSTSPSMVMVDRERLRPSSHVVAMDFRRR
jgi:hypothetical protein